MPSLATTAETDAIKGVVYDLDGTLIDSSADVGAAINNALSQHGLSSLPVAVYSRLMGGGERKVCSLALEELGVAHDEAMVESVFQKFVTAYKETPVMHTKPYPGTMAGLARLQEMGFSQGICTNKTAASSQLVLEELGMSGYFGSVIGCDATPNHKPNPAHLEHVATELGVGIDEIVYVGDTIVDLATAKAAGVRYFSVAWASDTAQEEGYSETLTSLEDLPKLLRP